MPTITFMLELSEDETLYLWATVLMDMVLDAPYRSPEQDTVREKLKRLLEGK